VAIFATTGCQSVFLNYPQEKFGWKHVLCVENGEIRTIDDISKEVISLTEKIL